MTRERDPTRRDEAPPDTPGPSRPGEDAAPLDAPPAGPHADPRLLDPEKTPGAGALPSPDQGGEADAGAG